MGSIKGSFHRYIAIGIGEFAASAGRMYRQVGNGLMLDEAAIEADNPQDPWNSVSDDDTHR